ncbi:MAG: ATP synthase F1 subunit epsilon [Clostridia bacterium]|nr:ATP synthase F1 subunit epsilon [Clostridia bacterium]
MKPFKLSIYASDKIFFEGEVSSVILPIWDGQYGIQSNHTNVVSAVVPGVMKYTLTDGEEKYAAISGGLVKVENGDALVLSETVESPEEIDENRAKAELERAREALIHKQSIRDYKNAETKIAKALSRLRAKHSGRYD